MALPTKSLSQIVSRALGNFRTAFEGWPLGEKKFLGRTARSVGNLVWQLHKSVEDVDRDIVPTAQSSTDALSLWAEELGLPDGEGGYGRLKPTTATGGIASLSGVNGTLFPANTTATAEDGTTQIKLLDAVTISGSPPGFGTVSGEFIAVTSGTVGNLEAGTVMTWDSPPAGADSTFTLTTGLEGGIDSESNAAVYARIVARLQTPPRGGVEQDYRDWTAEVDGIRAYVYPKRSGTGTVDVVIVQAGTGVGRVPSDAQLEDVEDSIGEGRPADIEDTNVMVPYTANDGLVIKIRVVPSGPKYAFDWDDTASTYSVDTGGYAAGPPAEITLNTLAPATLKAAIDSYNAGTGLAPRLQVISTGSVINKPIRAVDWSDGGGKTTLTLETLPTGWVAPTDGDKVFAYGPCVETIANGILAYVNSVGPSRASGFADDITPWNDTIAISGIIAVAEQAIDTDGTELIQKVPVGDTTIDASPTDVTGTDTSVPELLYAESIAVVAAE